MDEKTQELRDIFVEVTEESTVTERQDEARGSLTEDDERRVAERLEDVIGRMRGRYEFETDLPDEALRRLVRRFYDEASDGEIADALDVSRRDVFDARTDLHLLRDSDTAAPFDLEELRDLLDAEYTDGEAATVLDTDESTIGRYRQVIRTRQEIRQTSGRFRDEFDEILTDADLGARMTEDVRETGLEDATEGMETDVSF